MPKTAKKLFSDNFKEKIWAMFLGEIEKAHSRIQISGHLRSFMTESEIAVLEKRLAALYWLNQGESLRETSKKSGLVKKAVVSVKHGFRKPIPRPVLIRKATMPEKRPRRRTLPYYNVSDKLINELRRRR